MSEPHIGSADDVVPESDAEAQVDRGKPVDGAGLGTAGEIEAQIKKISSWAAIIFAPTLVGTVYGMNFDVMPELGWPLGSPFSLGLMLLFALTLYVIFKVKKWL